jgi:nitrite reductase/ring-hydroxylating ferredoxin subunit
MSDATFDPTRIICRLDDLDNPGSRAFTLGSGQWPLRGFVVRRGPEVFAYVNRCPHAGHPLNWQPDQFLSFGRTLIQCNSHGALFQIDTGACVAGPCVGDTLTALAVRIENGTILLDADPQQLSTLHA